MSFPLTSAANRLGQVKDSLTGTRKPTSIPWDPDCNVFPTRKELPEIAGAVPGAAWVWGEDDNLGRINLLTPTRTKAAAAEIKTGEVVPLNLPLDVPKYPGFSRQQFKHQVLPIHGGVVFDDVYELNTQSGTQWDGFRHYSVTSTSTFYNGVKPRDIDGPKSTLRDSVHHISDHGITGRGILLDYYSYAKAEGKKYDPYTCHRVTLDELFACAKSQGIDPRPAPQGGDIKVGDLLFVRTGFIERYNELNDEERLKASKRDFIKKEQEWAGIEDSEEMIDWLHDCYFATVGGDAPAFEAVPFGKNVLHEYLLPRWGCPIGEMVDLERLSKRCKELNRWTFFVASSPANCVGGVSSHVNGLAIL